MKQFWKYSLHICIFAILATLFVVPSVAQDDEKFVYWGGLIFSEEANDLIVARIEEWGEMNDIEVEVVMINQNETVQRVSAAIEAGTMPDALDMGRGHMLLLSQNDLLVTLGDLYDEIGEEHVFLMPQVQETSSIAVLMCLKLLDTPKHQQHGKKWVKWQEHKIRQKITGWVLHSLMSVMPI